MPVTVPRAWLLGAVSICVAACAPRTPAAVQPTSHSIAVTTGGSAHSAIFLERVDSGVIMVDLGWTGADDALAKGLSRIGATPDDVIAVFLTHSHRDHIAGWKSVSHAPFHLAEAEVPLLFGEKKHGGVIPKVADRLNEPDLPRRGQINVRPFASDTFMVFGADTLRIFNVPGHTAGSAAYLFRGKLFAGDAISQTWRRGFVPALPVYSEDTKQAGRSLISLRARLAPHHVRVVCTAHLECADADDAFWRDVLKDAGGDARTPAQEHVSDDAAVYTAVLDANFADSKAQRLVIQSMTRKGINRVNLVPEYWSSLTTLPGLDSTTLRNFEVANLEPARMPALPASKIPVVFADDSVFTNIRAMPLAGDTSRLYRPDRYWMRFYARFPCTVGTTQFSRIGYSKDGFQAIVAVDHGCGSLCGSGEFVLLTKVNGVWAIVHGVQTWVS